MENSFVWLLDFYYQFDQKEETMAMLRARHQEDKRAMQYLYDYMVR